MNTESSTQSLSSLVRRVSLLRHLDAERVDKPSLQSALGTSRSTIDRGIRELQNAGYVEREDGAYRTTLTGRLALESYDQFVERIRGTVEAADVLSSLDVTVALSPDVLATAEIVRPDQTAPQRPIERIRSIIGGATRIRTVVSAISKQYVDLYYDRIDDGVETSLVLSPSVLGQLVSKYQDRLTDALARENVEIRQSDAEPPFGLTIVEQNDDRLVELTVYGPTGLRGVVVNDTPAAVAWAEEFYATRWDGAQSLPLLATSDDSQ